MHPRGFLAQELADLLEALGERALNLQWECRNVEVSGGEKAQDLYSLDDNKLRVSGTQLLEVARGITQTIEGTFVGFDAAGAMSMVIKNIRGSLWEVFGKRADLRNMRKSFRDVRDSQYEEPYN